MSQMSLAKAERALENRAHIRMLLRVPQLEALSRYQPTCIVTLRAVCIVTVYLHIGQDTCFPRCPRAYSLVNFSKRRNPFSSQSNPAHI
jgi:hypothetical protein